MPSVVLLNQEGKEVGSLQLSEDIFAHAEHQQAIFDTIIAERAAMRQGTQKAKGRSEVSGGGRKPWRQKGTGRARQGSIRAAQWRGGGVIFAPTPRSHAIKVNKKVVRLAMKCSLSEKVSEEAFIVLDALNLDNFKTKSLVKVLDDVNSFGKVLVIVDQENPNVELAGRNIPYACVSDVRRVSVYQMKNADCVVITEAAVKYYEEVLK
ncbi:MAG: 50S ribosomal protein L4 [Bacilli bacterium]|nr:50S ribosomal protein L4 [Bacilli bacterium]